MKKYQIKLSVSRLEKENIVTEDTFGADFLELENDGIISVASPVNFSFEAQLHASGIVIRGNASVKINGECGRCLEPVTQDIETEYTIMLDELGNADEIDISDYIREEILLAFPANIICSDNCAGLCPYCGINLNNGLCKCRDSAPAAPSPWDKLDELK